VSNRTPLGRNELLGCADEATGRPSAPRLLNGGNDPGHTLSPGCHLEISSQRAEGAATKFPQKPAVVFEEDAQHPGDGEDDLAVGDIEEKLLPHPLAPFLQALGMAGGAKSPGAAGE
jgi:hypothetical protein